MSASDSQAVAQETVENPAIDPRLKPLLDHAACELAHEYIRVMEAAAETSDAAIIVEDQQS